MSTSYSSDSDSDRDEALEEDLAALRQACILSGADPDAAVAEVSSFVSPAADAAAAAVSGGSSDDDEGGEDEDLALLRRLREHLHLKTSPSLPLLAPSSARPICAWPPSDSDEEEQDLETLRAIQRRFSHYQTGTSIASPNYMKTEASHGECVEILATAADEEFEVNKQNAKVLTGTRFPKAAHLLLDALKKNRSCQKLIRRKMINIEAKIEENKDLRDRVKCLMDFQTSCRKALGKFLCQKEDPRVRLISTRKPIVQCQKNKYKKTPALSLGPAENPLASKYKMVLRQFPMSFQKQPWTDAERDKLVKGIKQQYQETLILDSMNNESAIGDFSAVDMAYALTSNGGDFEVTPENLRLVLPLTNWDKIAAMYLPGRSGAECESRWLNCDDPLINHNSWTAQEEKRLLLIVQERGIYNWINIAVALGTHRTPFQCLARYQRSLNPHILNKEWTKEEDLQLQAAVETFGENWQLVSASLDGRTGNQCSNRWRKSLNPERTRVGRWDVDEDKRLMVAVKLFGFNSWSKISRFIPGRTQSQCSERWVNVLDPNLCHGPWSLEEDSKLLDAVHKYGRCWSKISWTIIPNRNDNMCMRRWNYLCKHELPSVRAANRMKKNALVSNFVDRERERPAIGPNDFISLAHTEGDGGDGNTLSDQVKKPKAWSRKSCKNSSAKDASKSSACMSSADSDVVSVGAVVNTTVKASRRKSSGRSRKQTEENVAVSEGVNNSSSGRKGVRSRRKSSISADDEVVQKTMMGSVSVGDDGLVKKRMRGSVSVGDDGTVKKRMRGSGSIDDHGVVTKRKRASSKSLEDNSAADGAVNASYALELPGVPSEGRDADAGNVNRSRRKSTPRSRSRKQTEENVAVSKGVNNSSSGRKGVRSRRKSSISADDEVVQKTMRGSVSVDDDGTVKKRMRGSVSIDDHGVVTKRKRASSKSLEDNSAADGAVNASYALELPGVPSEGRHADAGNVNRCLRKSTPSRSRKQTEENLVVSEGVNNTSSGRRGVRSRRKSFISADDEVVHKTMRGSVSVGDDGIVKKRMRGSVSVGDDGTVKKRMRGSVSVGDHGVVTKRKRASSKSLEDNLAADGAMNASYALELPAVPSEGRDADAGNMNKSRRKSTPRPKQVDMAEGSVGEYSTCMRLDKCMSFVHGNGTNNNERHSNSSVEQLFKAVQSNGADENPNISSVAISAGPDPTSFKNGIANTSDVI